MALKKKIRIAVLLALNVALYYERKTSIYQISQLYVRI